MIVAVAACPHPPLLVPAAAAGAAGELADLRAACGAAIRQVLAASPEVICLVGAGEDEQWYADGAGGSLRPYGVAVDVPLERRIDGPATLPLSLTIGAWLLHEVGWAGPRRALSLPAGAGADELSRLSVEVDELAATVGLLVMGDGSARRSERAPGYVDQRAAGFDAGIALALGAADTASLSALEPALGLQLMSAGTAPWRFLGCAAAGAGWDAVLLADVAPYGVGYFVAAWSRRS